MKMPKVSFLLLCYNQERFVKDAVQGALDQDYANIEIIISDDASSDSTMEIINEVVSLNKKNKEVIVRKNESNLGLIDHINELIELASGELIVLAAGDDISFPERTSKIVAEYIAKGKPLLLHSKAMEIDELGNYTGRETPGKELRTKLSIEEAALAYGIYLGASGAWSRKLINTFGKITYRSAVEDLVMGFRAIALDSIEYIDLPLLKYRAGVGISQYRPKTLKEKILRRKKGIPSRLHVLSQHIEDIGLLESFPKSLLERIEKEKLKSMFSYYINYHRKIPTAFLLNNKSLFIAALYCELRFLCGCVYRKISKNQWSGKMDITIWQALLL
jgi:glycosyltransferase involved in cell wall biosynthesis